MKYKLNDSKLPEMFSRELYDQKNGDLAPEHLHKIYDSLFIGVANILKVSKTMEHPVAYEFVRFDQTFIAACVVQYFPNEDETNPGNWNMIWTFNENDIPENTLRISINDPQTHCYFRGVAGEKYGMKFEDSSSIVTTMTFSLEMLKKWLDENASESEEVVIEQEGLFQARTAVEGGEKVFSIEADGEVKNIIKDDAAIEK